MGERPLLFLDVDGVLNCLRGGHREYTTRRGLSVWVPLGATDRVAVLAEAFDPVWATAWLGSAHAEWKDLLGLSPFPWPYISYSDLKLPEIIRYAKGRPFAWVDDDAEWELGQLGWDRSMVDGLIVNPSEPDGLTDEHVDQLLAYAKQVAA